MVLSGGIKFGMRIVWYYDHTLSFGVFALVLHKGSNGCCQTETGSLVVNAIISQSHRSNVYNAVFTF